MAIGDLVPQSGQGLTGIGGGDILPDALSDRAGDSSGRFVGSWALITASSMRAADVHVVGVTSEKG